MRRLSPVIRCLQWGRGERWTELQLQTYQSHSDREHCQKETSFMPQHSNMGGGTRDWQVCGEIRLCVVEKLQVKKKKSGRNWVLTLSTLMCPWRDSRGSENIPLEFYLIFNYYKTLCVVETNNMLTCPWGYLSGCNPQNKWNSFSFFVNGIAS